MIDIDMISLALFSSFDYWGIMKHRGVPLLPKKKQAGDTIGKKSERKGRESPGTV